MIILFGALVLSGGSAAHFFGTAMIPAALAGMIMGCFGTVFSSRMQATRAGLSALAAALAAVSVPAWMIPAAIVPALCFLAGREAGAMGTRASSLAILAWVMLLGPAESGSFGALCLTFTVTFLLGCLLALGLGAEGLVARPPAGRRYGRTHAIAMSIGLAACVVVSWQFENAGASWIVTLFAVRALDAPGTHMRASIRAGLATVLGAITAALVTLLPLAVPVFTALGLVFFLLGLRVLPAPGARSSMFMSAGVVLATAPTVDSALFRVLAALLAASLAVTLSLASSYLRDRLS